MVGTKTALVALLVTASVSIALILYGFTSFTATTSLTSTESTTVTSTEMQTVQSTVTVETMPVLYTSNLSSDGLQLRVGLNSSSIESRDEVVVHIELSTR